MMQNINCKEIKYDKLILPLQTLKKKIVAIKAAFMLNNKYHLLFRNLQL